jgi:hypothetical protein
MKAQQPQRLTGFDARSVMLFTVLALSGVGALQAQTTAAPSGPQFGPGTPSATSSTHSAGPSSAAAPSANHSVSAAFDRADTNQDGQLSAQEARQLPAIAQRFKALDTDHSGSLSRAEFEKGANP